jgi:hypothetical protein
MGGTIRYLPYLRIPDLAYKLITCVHHQYDNTVRHRLKDPSNNILLFIRWIVETLEQRWLEVSLDLVILFSLRMLVEHNIFICSNMWYQSQPLCCVA